MPEALYFTEDEEANRLLADDPFALLVGFALDQQVTVQQAFLGPLRLKQRLGTLEPAAVATADLEPIFREKPAIHRFPGSMAQRVQALATHVRDEYDGKADRIWAEAPDSGALRANLAALLTEGKATVIDSATVSTMNNVPATIIAFSQSFIFLPVRQQIQGAGLVTTYTPQPLVIPTQLSATPRVNGDGTITMLIPFSISRPTGTSIAPDGTQIPNQVGTQIFVLRRVPSGATVVVGALSDKSDSDTTNRIPLLSDLPIIGPLFRSKTSVKNDGETLFFFTPTLLPDLPGQTEAAP